MDSSLPGSFVHGIIQARVLKWVAVPSLGHLPNPGIEPRSSPLQLDSFYCLSHKGAHSPPKKKKKTTTEIQIYAKIHTC